MSFTANLLECLQQQVALQAATLELCREKSFEIEAALEIYFSLTNCELTSVKNIDNSMYSVGHNALSLSTAEF